MALRLIYNARRFEFWILEALESTLLRYTLIQRANASLQDKDKLISLDGILTQHLESTNSKRPAMKTELPTNLTLHILHGDFLIFNLQIFIQSTIILDFNFNNLNILQ